MDLDGKIALVTGANRGIGRAIAEELAKRPLELLLAGMRDTAKHSPLSGAAREIRPVEMDLSSRESIDRGCDRLAELDRIDLLVNNAGQFVGGLLEEQDIDEVYSMFQVNLVGLVHLTRRTLPGMLSRDGGKIVNNASISGYAWFPNAASYSGTKAGVVGFSESLRRELKDTGVSVTHLVTPGVDTEMLEETKESFEGRAPTSGWDENSPAEWAEKVVNGIESDDDVVGPGGKTALAKLASRGPGRVLDFFSARVFTRPG